MEAQHISAAHELKQKLDAARPVLADEDKSAQFHRALGDKFPGLSEEEREELFQAEFEHVLASVRIKKVEVAPDAGDLAHNG